ncbi:hypothetical protein Bbelb_372650 [Branchiostoma belcheri]|nr:hypothetical protein Bbelb_372650 [Branchiostoma belcheri]
MTLGSDTIGSRIIRSIIWVRPVRFPLLLAGSTLVGRVPGELLLSNSTRTQTPLHGRQLPLSRPNCYWKGMRVKRGGSFPTLTTILNKCAVNIAVRGAVRGGCGCVLLFSMFLLENSDGGNPRKMSVSRLLFIFGVACCFLITTCVGQDGYTTDSSLSSDNYEEDSSDQRFHS